jgi:WD40 repeat protein
VSPVPANDNRVAKLSGRAERVGGPAAYDAFMSYSHALDGTLAPTFQRELERFAKPWYRTRSLRVFRDDVSLGAHPGLWTSIEQALTRSDWFLLMASPEAARSPWVDREVRWWLANRSPQNLLIALTGGELTWAEQGSDAGGPAATSLPPALRGALREEPRWVDLRWLREATNVDRSNPRLRDCAADIAAAIRRTPKDLLVGEHIRQHRRAMLLARGAVSALAVLLVTAVVAAAVAVGQRDKAQDRARVATARQLAALAVSNLGSHLDLAQLYAVAAYRMEDDPLTRSALFQAVTASRHLVRVLPVGAQAGAVAGAGTARVAVAGTGDGRLIRWDLARNAVSQVRAGSTKIIWIATDGTGGRTVASNGSTLFIWNGADSVPPTALPVPQPLPPEDLPQQYRYLAISPSGRTVAAIRQGGGNDARLLLLDGATGRVLRARKAEPTWSAVGLPDDRTLTAADGIGDWSRLSVATLRVTAGGGQPATPGDAYYCCGFSADARYSVWAKYNIVNLLANQPGPPAAQALTTTVPLRYPDRSTVSADGTEMAVAGGGALYVTPTSPDSENPPEQLTGTGNVDSVAFVGGNRQLVSSTGSTLMFWDLRQPSRITTGRAVDATDTPNAGDQPLLGISPDGRHLALSGADTYRPVGGSGNLVVADVGESARGQLVTAPFADAVPVWSADGGRLLLVGSNGDVGYGAVWWSGGVFTGAWRTPNANEPVAARLSPDGRRVVVVSDHGDIQVRRMSDGAVLTSAGGGQQPAGPGSFGTRNYAAVSADTATVYLVGADRAVHVVDPATGRQHALPGPAAVSVAAAEDRLLVTRADNSLQVWDRTGARLLRTVPADAGYTPVLAAVPGSRLVARLSDLGTVSVWNIDTGALLGSFTLPRPARSTGQPAWYATTLAAGPDGHELVSASADGSIIRWQLDPAAWVRSACATAGRDLSEQEWRAQVNGAPPADPTCPR